MLFILFSLGYLLQIAFVSVPIISLRLILKTMESYLYSFPENKKKTELQGKKQPRVADFKQVKWLTCWELCWKKVGTDFLKA